MNCNCEKIKDQFADYLTGDIDGSAMDEVRSHIASCAACREEIETLSAVWTKLGVLPQEQPSGRLRANFYAMLEEAKAKQEKEAALREPGRVRTLWKDFWAFRKPAYALSFSLVLLCVGIGAGYIFRAGSGAGSVASMRQELQDMRQTVALSMMTRPSAAERIEGVGWSAQVERPTARTLEALIRTLDEDPNVNVRLAAIDALYLFRGHPAVKDSLVRALTKQDSPLVQVALIDLLVEIRERRAVDALKSLIGTAKLNPEVKQHAELGLKQII
jgi:anti-sigma factor RsiW